MNNQVIRLTPDSTIVVAKLNNGDIIIATPENTLTLKGDIDTITVYANPKSLLDSMAVKTPLEPVK